VQLRLRTSITSNSVTGYVFKFRLGSDGSQYVQIARLDGALGNWTKLGGTTGPGLKSGDVIKATAVGNTLTAYINGVAITSLTDSSYSGGSPGLGFNSENATAADSGLTDFQAADNIKPSSVTNEK